MGCPAPHNRVGGALETQVFGLLQPKSHAEPGIPPIGTIPNEEDRKPSTSLQQGEDGMRTSESTVF